MTTFADLVNEVSSSLHSYTGVQEQVTWLTADITSSTLTVPVNGPENALRGVTEIGDELLYVFATGDSGLSLAPFGRGYRGTTAAAHQTNDMVTIDPAWPRFEIKRALNQAIKNLYPTLYQIKTSDLTIDGNTIGYQLPDDADEVLRVEWRAPGDAWNLYAKSLGWTVDTLSPSGGGRVLNLFEDIPAGSSLRVVYQAPFGTLSGDTDTLDSVGLNDNHIDLLVYAVAARMIRFLDPARLQVTSVENSTRGQLVGVGDAGKIANQMYAMYQQRLSEERRRLLNLNPPSMNFSG